MALGADRAFLKTSSQMEHRSSGSWKSRIPGFIRNGHTRPLAQVAGDGSRLPHGQDTKDSDREKSAGKKSVTMAPTSRYMTSRRLYTARKPLITAERQISILKNPLAQECSDTLDLGSVENYQKEMEGAASEHSDTCTPESASIPQFIASSPSASREDLYASLSLSDLRLGSFLEEPDFSSVSSANKNERRSLSSPPVGDFSLTVPLSPKWSSTQRTLSHSYSSQTRHSRQTKTKVSEQGKDSYLKIGSSLSFNKEYSSEPKRMSTYQANYWACAIPSSLAPSPDRRSPSWDPDKEYQALLDYTYPIRPNMGSTWSSSKCRSRLQTDPLLQDSGIELDRFCSSSSLSCLDQSLAGIGHTRGGPASGQRLSEPRSLNLRELSHSKSSDGRLSSSLYSSLDQVGLSVESLDCEGKQSIYQRKSGIFSTPRSAPIFIRSSCIFPLPGSFGELDEEFLRLPEQLQELQDLSHQLRDITAQMNQPVNTSWESLEKESRAQVEHQAADVSTTQEEQDEVDRRSASEVPLRREKLSEQLKGLGDRVQMISSEVNKGSLREVGAIIDQLSGTTLTEFQRKTGTNLGEDETKESLLQHIQAFCSNLEELIQWLYKVVEKMEVLSPPTVDIDSVKASLTDYKSFQKEIQAHQPLTASVLQTGEMLLCCMNSASPFLKETLMLIERQSRVLETHSEHLFSSILSAMDCLTEPHSQDDTERTS
ncbi:centrosomal protein of 68 kDa [Salminus brasiliensis]|uniref:centrosomal protein of 68 kDa n=1 Tax=Salminus brasiliensis TaxID=930266 RepID=UPI003B831F15